MDKRIFPKRKELIIYHIKRSSKDYRLPPPPLNYRFVQQGYFVKAEVIQYLFCQSRSRDDRKNRGNLHNIIQRCGYITNHARTYKPNIPSIRDQLHHPWAKMLHYIRISEHFGKFLPRTTQYLKYKKKWSSVNIFSLKFRYIISPLAKESILDLKKLEFPYLNTYVGSIDHKNTHLNILEYTFKIYDISCYESV